MSTDLTTQHTTGTVGRGGAVSAGIAVVLALLAAPLVLVAALAAPTTPTCGVAAAGAPAAASDARVGSRGSGSTSPPATTPAAAAAGVAAAGAVPAGLGLEDRQWQHATTVVAVGRQMQVPDQGVVVALATALQESGLRVYANDGHGGDLAPEQHGIAASLRLPHDAVGTDHGSLGLFQQQWPWWGTMPDLMDPAASATAFYTALLAVPDWQSLPVTVAAQTVQHSAYPTAYADDEPLARRILTALGGTGTTGVGDPGDAAAPDCPAGTSGVVVYPLPPGSGYVDQRNFAEVGDSWASTHTGTDLSVACGTPVLAATAGTVRIDRRQPWAGPWLVQVSAGPVRLTTWYAHMRRVTVTDGQPVTPGQQLGEVGDLGNATGCHLHFEVHPHGGSIYEDPVDPSAWLKQHVGRPLPGLPIGRGVVVGSYNVLGSSHTARGGNKPGWAPGSTRIRDVVDQLNSAGVAVVGLQEFQRTQARVFDRYAAEWDRYAAPDDPQNTVAWRTDTYRLVSGFTVPVPYFGGHRQPMPVARLRSVSTGAEMFVGSFHNPASTRLHAHQQRYRTAATRLELRLVHRLLVRHGLPVVVTGDFNERARFFCAATRTGELHAAAGGSTGHDCHPPSYDGIDWILATPDVTFSGWSVDDSRRGDAGDHPLVTATIATTQPLR